MRFLTAFFLCFLCQFAQGQQSHTSVHAQAYLTDTSAWNLTAAIIEAGSMTGGSLRGIPGSVHILTPKQLKRYGDTDVHRALRWVPGVNIQEEDGFGLRPNIGIRGSGAERSARINLMEDGVPISPAPYTAPSAYYFPTVGRMQGVEVVKGSCQIAYGPNTIGGAVNLLSTKIPTTLGGQVTARAGAFGTQGLHFNVGNGSGQIGWLVEAHRSAASGFKQLDDLGGTPGQTGFEKWDFMGKLRWMSSASARVDQFVELKLGRVSELSNQSYAGLTADDFEATPYRQYAGSRRDLMDADQRQVVLTHVASLGSTWKWTNQAYATAFNRNWYKSDRVADSTGSWVKLGELLSGPATPQLDIFRGNGTGLVRLKANNRSYFSLGLQSRLAWEGQWNGWQKLEIGLRRHHDGVDRFQWTDNWRIEDGAMIDAVFGEPGTESNRLENTRAWASFARAKWNSGRLSIMPGLRIESIAAERSDYGKTDPERTGSDLSERSNHIVAILPGIGLQFDASEKLEAFIGAHRGFATPGSSPDTQAEFGVNTEAGIRWNSARSSGSAVAFAHFGRNLLGSDFASSGGTGTGEMFNGGTTTVAGLELDGRIQLSKALEFQAAYTFTDARFTSAFTSDFSAWGAVSKGDYLPYLSRHQFTARAGWIRGDFSADISARWSEAMRTEAGQAPLSEVETVGAATVLDAALHYQFTETMRLNLGVLNLTDQVYTAAARPAGLRPGLPRTLSAGFHIDF